MPIIFSTIGDQDSEKDNLICGTSVCFSMCPPRGRPKYLSVNDLATAAPREISNRVGKQAKKGEKAQEAFDSR